MSINMTAVYFERHTWFPGQLSAPGSTAVVPARREIYQNPNVGYPRFPSVPTYAGWRVDYVTNSLHRWEDGEGSTDAAVGFESFDNLMWLIPNTRTPSPYTLTVQDTDLGTAVVGAGMTVSISFPAESICAAYSTAYPDFWIGMVQCINPTLNQVAWQARYFLLDNVLLRAGAWAACQTDFPVGTTPNVLIQIAPGGARVPTNYAVDSAGIERFYLVVSRSQPIPALALWGAGRDYYHEYRDGDLDNQVTPHPDDPNYKSYIDYCEQITGAVVVGVPNYDPSRAAYLIVLNTEGLARRATEYVVPYYIYSASYFEPVTLSFQGVTLTGEPLGLLPPGVQVINVHVPPLAGGSGGHTNNAPGASPALLGHPSRHYNRAVAALNADRTSTTGILFWRSTRAIPLMTTDSILVGAPPGGLVWDTPGAGISITAQTGDESPSLAEDVRGILYCLFHRPSQGAMLSRSDSDGDSWNTPLMAIPGGAHPAIRSLEGRIVCAAVTTTGTAPNLIHHITAVYRGPGDATFSTLYPFQFISAGALTPLSVADDGFGIDFTDEGPGRMGLHVLMAGESATSDWWSADNGQTWTRIPIS